MEEPARGIRVGLAAVASVAGMKERPAEPIELSGDC